jgi:hypothetical protein
MDNRNLTPASHWKQRYDEGIEVEMPDGSIVRMRPTVDTTYLIATGKIPDGLTAIALEGLNFDSKDKNALKDLGENIKRLNDLYQIVCIETWIHPRIVDNPQKDDEISFKSLTKEEKEFTWNLINRPVSEWKRFLHQWNASLELVPNGTADTASPKQVAKSKPVG